MADDTPAPPPVAPQTNSRFISPTFVSDQKALGPAVVASNAVASSVQMNKIFDALDAKVGADASQKLAFALALACKDQGSSSYVQIAGDFEFGGQSLPLQAAVVIVQECCTLRQFCMFYAKHVWNYMLQERDPPAYWAAKGFTEQNKYAGFDFFNGVTNQHSLAPESGLLRQPTSDELQASHLNRTLAIQGSRQNTLFSTRDAPTFQEQVSSRSTRPQIG